MEALSINAMMKYTYLFKNKNDNENEHDVQHTRTKQQQQQHWECKWGEEKNKITLGRIKNPPNVGCKNILFSVH